MPTYSVFIYFLWGTKYEYLILLGLNLIATRTLDVRHLWNPPGFRFQFNEVVKGNKTPFC